MIGIWFVSLSFKVPWSPLCSRMLILFLYWLGTDKIKQDFPSWSLRLYNFRFNTGNYWLSAVNAAFGNHLSTSCFEWLRKTKSSAGRIISISIPKISDSVSPERQPLHQPDSCHPQSKWKVTSVRTAEVSYSPALCRAMSLIDLHHFSFVWVFHLHAWRICFTHNHFKQHRNVTLQNMWLLQLGPKHINWIKTLENVINWKGFCVQVYTWINICFCEYVSLFK